jgi:hypothetical protein
MKTKDEPLSRGLCVLVSVVLAGISWWFYYHDDTLKAIFWAFLSWQLNPNPAFLGGMMRVLQQVKDEK